MWITSTYLATLLRVSIRTVQYMVKKLPIPHTSTSNGFIFDLDSLAFRDFFLSVKMVIQNKSLKAIYSTTDIARLLNVCRKVAIKILNNLNIKIYYNGPRRYILLIDLQRIRAQSVAKKA